MKSGDTEAAEDAILDYYKDSKIIRMMIVSRGTAAEAYKPRKQLALYALEEYENGRYYSCVPLLLMIIDGIVSFIFHRMEIISMPIPLMAFSNTKGSFLIFTKISLSPYSQSAAINFSSTSRMSIASSKIR